MSSQRPYVSVSGQVVDPEHWGSVRVGTANMTASTVDMTAGTVVIRQQIQ